MGLHQNMLRETVAELNLREAVMCRAGETVSEAICRMRQAQLGCVIVVDENRHPIGMLTESMITQMVAHKPTALQDKLRSHATNHCPWVRLTDPIVDVLRAMQAKNTRFICVVDEAGCVTALTGQKGLMEYIAEHFPGQVMVQRVGLSPITHDREGA